MYVCGTYPDFHAGLPRTLKAKRLSCHSVYCWPWWPIGSLYCPSSEPWQCQDRLTFEYASCLSERLMFEYVSLRTALSDLVHSWDGADLCSWEIQTWPSLKSAQVINLGKLISGPSPVGGASGVILMPGPQTITLLFQPPLQMTHLNGLGPYGPPKQQTAHWGVDFGSIVFIVLIFVGCGIRALWPCWAEIWHRR